jgi:phosphoribosylformimino-5-aminoimidazole carboxamide ribotide isomerase
VIDLRGGVVVHARRGRRDEYATLHTDPVALARELGGRCRTRTLYVADLDAIEGGAPDVTTLGALTAVAHVWLDAGAQTVPGVSRRVLGTESLPSGADSSPGAAPSGAESSPGAAPLVLSVDLRDGRLISQDPALAGREAVAAVPIARELAVAELLVIDLALVGSGKGPPLAAVATLAEALEGVEVYAGGGVRDDADLRALERAGAAGALVATALHEGRITP